MVSNYLNQLLERLNLLSTHAVFFTGKKNRYSPVFTIEVQQRLDLIKPDAFYSFNNKPYILFFDLSEESDNQREDEIHKQVWSFDSAPVIFIIKRGDIEVYNAFYYQKNQNKLERLTVDENEIIEQFSFWNVQSGNTWQWLQAEKYKDTINKKRVNQRLFDNIKTAREYLEETGLSTTDANITILRLIFIRYLIDRGVGIKKEFISGESIFERRKSLSELIQNSSHLADFFDYLNDRFNGTLFKQKSSFRLKKDQGLFLSQIFDVRKDKISPSLFDTYYFDVFDFSIIPVEVISGIYESIIDEETKDNESAIYTPPFLVEYILEETVDKFLRKKKRTEFKVLDPACGSGIFLVQSYRRMVDEEIKKNKTTNIESGRLREIAENNLFGIDLNEQALLVASFSIYIAILDYKEPKEINRFIFPNLIEKNLFKANFFDTSGDYNKIISNQQFDFILGNPPWKNGSKDKHHVEYLKDNKLLEIVGDYQLAQSFILRTRSFTNKNTECCLIVTSKAIYNNNADNFRKFFLKKFFLRTCFDLSAVRRLIFEGADNPAMILVYQDANNKDALENIVAHYSLKYNIYLKHYKSLVIEKADIKRIKQSLFYENHYMFKVALYGGIFDFALIKRLIKDRDSIEDFISNESFIKAGNGIHKGTAKKYFTELIGLPIIETEELQQYYTSVSTPPKRLKREDVFLERGRNLSLFKGNKILFTRRPKQETFISASLCLEDAVFRNSAYGIAINDNETLYHLFSIFISDLFTYFQYLTTSNWGIYHPEINKSEYLSFPFIQIEQAVKNKLASLSKKFITPFISYYKNFNMGEPRPDLDILGRINEIIDDLYMLKTYERDLLDYILKIAIFQFQGEEKQKQITDFTNTEKTHYRNKDHVLRRYVDVFINEFREIYKEEYFKVDIYTLDYFIAINFSFLKDEPENNEDQISFIDRTPIAKFFERISSLSISQIANSTNPKYNLYIQRDIKGFEKDSFYIIKPNEYKCWHRAMAWYDVAEIKEKIEAAETETLTEN